MAKGQSDEYVEVEGKIVAVARDDVPVELANGHQVLAHLGKLRKHFIKITTGTP